MTETIDLPNLPFIPKYIEGTRGQLFTNYFPPAGHDRGTILVAPPFAEELNRCRSMVAMQARHFAANGIGVLLLDYFGTGDSGGEFADSTWEGWKDDIDTTLSWMQREDHTLLGLWGVRLGCLLLTDFLSSRALECPKLILWQPVLNGKSLVTQFLRIRIAALMARNETAPSTQDMLHSILDGNPVEVGGYLLTKDLIEPLVKLNMSECRSHANIEYKWFERIGTEGGELARPSLTQIEQLSQQGATVTPFPYTGPIFWQVAERCLAPELITATTSSIANAA